MFSTQVEKRSIPFTQFLRPNGTPTLVTIDRPLPIAEKAQAIIDAGYRFEIEELMTGVVHMTISDPEEGDDVAAALCQNGPAVPATVDKMILGFTIPKKKN